MNSKERLQKLADSIPVKEVSRETMMKRWALAAIFLGCLVAGGSLDIYGLWSDNHKPAANQYAEAPKPEETKKSKDVEKDDSAIKQTSDEVENANKENEFETIDEKIHYTPKLIPDQKVYKGLPDLVIDLEKAFDLKRIEDAYPKNLHPDKLGLGNGKIKVYEEVYNKKGKVAKSKIDPKDKTLTLEWGKNGKTDIIIRAVYENGAIVDTKFSVNVWEADYLSLLYSVIGGLGIFLLGMKNMSDGLQALAGNGLRRMISLVTDNRLLATAVGVLVTMTVQSSSITTVMVVGFVNSGFMNLTQAIGVIMGANIGTTITGWIIALKIGKYGLPMLGVGVFAYMFLKRDRFRYIGMFVMGLGMVFFGLEQMKNGFSMVKSLPEFEAWFRSFDASTYFGVLQCAAVGCVLTFIVQSSSATLGITITLAQIGVIQFETAAALVMGENIGTTITAWLASFGTTTNAKRAAYFHVIFNLVGVFWITLIFTVFYVPFIKGIMSLDLIENLKLIFTFNWSQVSFGVYDPNAIISAENSAPAIAAAHSCFNIINTLMFLPFAGFFATFLMKMVPEKTIKEKPHLTSLDIRAIETPVIAVEQSRVEILRMGEGCNKMMSWLEEILNGDPPDEKIIQKTFHREEVLDTIHDEIVQFITDVLASSVPHEIVEEGRIQLRMADEYESVSDYIAAIVKSHLKLSNSGMKIPVEQKKQLLEIHQKATEYVKLISKGYEDRQKEVITKAKSQGDAITLKVKEYRDLFLLKMSETKFDPQIGVAFNAQLNSYRRVRDHMLNVAEAMAGQK